ncbi:restriction endonuclease subunit S [Sediminibacterium sp.]|uniref:restriction endonuclease subunit S n=1 Tax=Sediminibacterium sp. TaxID=1917865 RepID=UPI002733196D|nr:restriction endonuclease subunit S [Sediminibacterium sp.]MDP3566414.1 restriction endonuclease subunit S [Sediminibacterium sp.]
MRPWHEKTLGEFVSLQRGHDLPTNNRGAGRVPVVGSFGITGYHDIARAKGPGVTVGRSGASAGAVYFVNEDYWPHNTCLFVTDFQGNNPRFAYYLLSRLDLPNHAVGSAQPSLNRNHISPLPIRVPDRPEQDRIAHVLSTLDDKIELNRRMNETLEQMAQAIFKDWFVDFGPVRRKQEGASDPIAIMGGLVQNSARAAELAALFPDALGDNDLPEGWRPNSLGKLFEIKIGRTPPRKEKHHFVENETEGVPWLSIRDLGTCGTFAYSTSECLTVDAVNGFRVPLIEKGTVVVSFKLTVGRVAIAERQMLSNEAIAQLASKAESPPTAFTYSFMKQYDYSQLGSTSSIATAVNSESIRQITLELPPEKLLSTHHELVGPLLNLIQSRGAENRTLAETRDYLLPKLMSGEVRVRDAEAHSERLLDA